MLVKYVFVVYELSKRGVVNKFVLTLVSKMCTIALFQYRYPDLVVSLTECVGT